MGEKGARTKVAWQSTPGRLLMLAIGWILVAAALAMAIAGVASGQPLLTIAGLVAGGCGWAMYGFAPEPVPRTAESAGSTARVAQARASARRRRILRAMGRHLLAIEYDNRLTVVPPAAHSLPKGPVRSAPMVSTPHR
jgi:hypothetical protein